MRRDHSVGSALNRSRAMACSFSGWPAVMRARRKISSAKPMSVPASAIAADPVEALPPGAPHRADRQPDEDGDVVRVVAEGLDPAAERGLLVLQPRDLAVAAVEHAGGQREEGADDPGQ